MNNVYINTNQMASWVVDKYFKNKDLVTIDEILCLLEDLSDDLEHMKEQYHDLHEDLVENYKPISEDEMYGISDRDFYDGDIIGRS